MNPLDEKLRELGPTRALVYDPVPGRLIDDVATLTSIQTAVHELEMTGATARAGTVVLASFYLGCDEPAIARLTGIPTEEIATYGQRLRASGVWTDQGIAIDFDPDKAGEVNVGIILFALCAEGLVHRRPAEKTYHPRRRRPAEGRAAKLAAAVAEMLPAAPRGPPAAPAGGLSPAPPPDVPALLRPCPPRRGGRLRRVREEREGLARDSLNEAFAGSTPLRSFAGPLSGKVAGGECRARAVSPCFPDSFDPPLVYGPLLVEPRSWTFKAGSSALPP